MSLRSSVPVADVRDFCSTGPSARSVSQCNARDFNQVFCAVIKRHNAAEWIHMYTHKCTNIQPYVQTYKHTNNHMYKHTITHTTT
jgi:hypothetical protein